MPSLAEYYFVADDIFPADVAIVFGITAWQRACARSVELYREGLAHKLLFTGGFNAALQAVEATQMAAAAREAGVPEADIIIEPQATNSADNVINARRCIDEVVGLDALNSILLVAIHFHMRRVKAIARNVFPDRIRIGCASYPSIHYTAANWSQSERGQSDVASEQQKLEAYLRKNGLAVVPG